MRGGRSGSVGCRERSASSGTSSTEGGGLEHDARSNNPPRKNEMREKCYTYDARGNGDGKTVNSLVGDHQNRITDYTAIVLVQGGT